MKILVINSGSSSLKYQLIDMETESVLAKGNCERIGIAHSNFIYKACGQCIEQEIDMPNHNVAVKLVLAKLTDKNVGVISSMAEIDGVGHRVVASGEAFKSRLWSRRSLWSSWRKSRTWRLYIIPPQ